MDESKSRAQMRRDKKKRKNNAAPENHATGAVSVEPAAAKKVKQHGQPDERKPERTEPRADGDAGDRPKKKKKKKNIPSADLGPGPASSPAAASSSGVSGAAAGGAAGGAAGMRVVDASRASLTAANGAYGSYEDILGNETLTSGDRAEALLQWLVAPMPVAEFMAAHYEAAPLLVRGRGKDYFGAGQGMLLSRAAIARTVRLQRLVQGHEVTLTKYDPVAAVRRNVHVDGTALLPSRFEEALAGGASVRLLAPQKHADALWALMSGLEEHFGAMVGANAYLTPGGSQGFAPHFDDIEAFVLQLEGRKRWRIYSYPDTSGNGAENAADDEEEEAAGDILAHGKAEAAAKQRKDEAYTGEACPLPRYSSADFKPGGLPSLLLDVVLEPGDLLFMPRGFVHQAVAEEAGDDCSLHVTLSTAQNNAWADFLELLVPQALAVAVAENVGLRRSLPPQYLNCMGAAHSDLAEQGGDDEDDDDDDDDADEDDADEDDDGAAAAKAGHKVSPRARLASRRASRDAFLTELGGFLETLSATCLGLADGASDQMGKRFLSDRLPPRLLPAEEARSREGLPHAEQRLLPLLLGRERTKGKGKEGKGTAEEGKGARVRMVRAGVARLMVEDGEAVVYHCMENARWHHGAALQQLGFPLDDGPALEMLLAAYPEPVHVGDLPHPGSSEDLETKADIAAALFREGFLVLADEPAHVDGP